MNGGRSHENAGELKHRGVKVNAKCKMQNERKHDVKKRARVIHHHVISLI